MSESPLVSIALCTYNGERFIKEQLESLVNQSYDNIEIIAFDDLSTDNTFTILSEYAVTYNYLKIFRNEINLGFRKNFERALKECSGSFIALCDQDDIWDLDKIKIQVENIKENTLIYHDSAFVDEKGENLNRNISDIINFYKGNVCYHFLLGNCISGHTCLFHRSLLKDLLPLPVNLYHDKWLGFIASSIGYISYVDLQLVKYRQHSNSDTDILRIRKSKKQDSLLKITQLTNEIETFHKFLPNDPFISKLYTLLKKRLDQYICLDLFLFIYRNRQILLFVNKKSELSKFNYCLKFFWGLRLKMLLRF